MPINTKITGSPESVRAAAHWLRDSLAANVSEAATQFYQARNSADSSWHGDAGDAFRAKMTQGAQKTDDLAAGVNGAAQHFDTYAAGLQSVQDDMRRIRDTAAAAGLQVVDDMIQEPGPPPPAPGPAPTGPAATPDAVQAYNSAVSAQSAHASLVGAFGVASNDAKGVVQQAKLITDTLVNVANDLKTKWFLTIGDLANGSVETLRAVGVSKMLKHSEWLHGEQAKFLAQMKTSATTSPANAIKEFDMAQTAARGADDAAAAAAKAETSAGKFALKAGGALAVAGIVYDVVAQDKPVGKAVVSGAAGFGTSIAVGMGVGTAIGGPVGTAVGAVAGTVAGLFTSGAVDALWDNGIGAVGDAISNGGKAIADTADAIGDAAEWVGGGIKDVWNAIF